MCCLLFPDKGLIIIRFNMRDIRVVYAAGLDCGDFAGINGDAQVPASEKGPCANACDWLENMVPCVHPVDRRFNILNPPLFINNSSPSNFTR
jgi:hypothetical protein